MPAARGAITAITFDFWDTLVRSDTPAFRIERRIAVAEVLARHGLPAEHDNIEAAFDHAWKRFDASWALNEQFTGHHAAEAVLEMLEHDPDAVVRREIIDAYLSAGRDVEIDRRVLVLEVGGRRHESVAHGEKGEDRLDRAGPTEQVARHRLRAGDDRTIGG